jgi:glucokinase-like ROK family protein
MMGKVDNRAMREVNRSIVLDMIRRGGRISRTDLARRSNLTKPTVSAIVDALIQDGAVREVGFGETVATGGRPARLLEFNDASAAYLGIHFGEQQTTVAVADARGEIRGTWAQPSVHGNPSKSIRALRPMVTDALQAAKIPRARLQAATATAPGLVDQETGVCVLAPNLGWRDFPLREALTDALGMPVIVNNITQSAAVAEGRVGAAQGVGSFVWVYVGTGIGSGVVLDGRVFFGRRGFSGEIGHCPVIDDGRVCACGRRGCLETVASAQAIVRAAGVALAGKQATRLRDIQQPLDGAAIGKAARDGDKVARQIFAEVGEYLGRGISYLLNLLNPEMVVLGGAVVGEVGDCLLEPVRASVARHALQADGVRIVPSVLGDRAELIGAVLVAMDQSVRSYRVVSSNESPGATMGRARV